KTIADRIERAGKTGARCVLDVEFIRQHHKTCAPATMTMLARFWGRDVDHLELAEQICYDGTPNDSERQWAIDSGFASREFTITIESARRLIDAGLPFTLTTIEPGNAHLQAVVGYDDVKGTLVIRDPWHRGLGEFLDQEMVARYGSTGPRGHVFAPASKADALKAIDLPDSDAYDRYHTLMRALHRHDRV